MDNETREMFNAVFAELDKLSGKMDKMDDKFDGKIARLDAKIDYVYESLSHEINACKLDRDVLDLLVKKTEEHEKRLDALETRASWKLV